MSDAHRICIIATPRSGSQYVASIIADMRSDTVDLSEPFEPTLNIKVALVDGKAIRIDDKNTASSEERIQETLDVLSKADPTQSIVMRIFLKHYDLNIRDVFETLKQCGFKFIILRRQNVVNQLLSYGIAMKTDTWSATEKTKKQDSKIQVDVGVIDDMRVMLLTFNELVKSLPVEYETIYYESAVSDLINLGYPANAYSGPLVKWLPEDPFTRIENLEEVKSQISRIYADGNVVPLNTDEILSRSNAKRKGRFNIKDTICRYAWDYHVLNLGRNELRVCCRTTPNQIGHDKFSRGTDLFTSFVPIISIRKSLLRGEKNDHCNSCWTIEDNQPNVNKPASARPGLNDFVDYVYNLRNFPQTNTSNLWADKTKEEITHQLENITEEDIDKFIRIDHTSIIELNLGNTCDLKCIYCSHHYSTQWAAEKLKYKEISISKIETELPKIRDTVYEDIFWKWFYERKAYDADTINFIGGEPLIIDKFFTYTDRIIKFLENDDRRGRPLELCVVSNFNTPPKQYQQFKNMCLDIISSDKVTMDFNISCESLGDRAEFIRTGTDWKLLCSNIEDFMQFLDAYDNDAHHKILFSVQAALNAACISDLPAFFTFFCELHKKYSHNVHFRPNRVTWPQWLNPDILPVEYAGYVTESLKIIRNHIDEGHVDYNNEHRYGPWADYIGFLMSVRNGIENPNKDNNARRDFAINIDQLCERRNMNFIKTFPEMEEFYIMCKELK